MVYRCCPLRPNELRIFDRSRFSRRFISVKNVLKILAFKSSVKCSPLVATRASRSPFSVMNRIMSLCRSCGALPNAVSRRISAQLPSMDSVKCSTHTPCSASAGGASFLQPVTLQGVAIWTKVCPFGLASAAYPLGNHRSPAKSSLLRTHDANPARPQFLLLGPVFSASNPTSPFFLLERYFLYFARAEYSRTPKYHLHKDTAVCIFSS
jgi:hypothetical protein